MRSSNRLLAVVGVVALAAAACGGSSTDVSAPTTTAPATTAVPTTTVAATTSTTTTSTTTTTEAPDLASLIRINDIQVLGSHNSYHLRPQPLVYTTLNLLSAELAESIDYSHLPLAVQLGVYGIRQLELDVFADPDGGLWSSRAALPVIDLPAESGIAELDEPGFKVLHTQDFDFETTCFSLSSCLTEVNEWSLANPSHLPVMILIEMKDETVAAAAQDAGVDLSAIPIDFTEPVPTTLEVLDSLDAEIVSLIPRDRLITPDDVRGSHDTLEDAVLADEWPLLAESRGKIMFALDNTGEMRDLYREPSDVLAGRVMFTSSEPGSPDAAFMKVNDPIGNVDRIDELVSAGYLVRTRTDTPTADARTGSTEMRDAALSSGAQFLSTDYYIENPAFATGYVVTLESRCNPVSSPDVCVDSLLGE